MNIGNFEISDISKTDLHSHTIYSDGLCSPRQMIEEAIKKGLLCYGISDHSYNDFEDCCMENGRLPSYLSELKALKAEYKDRIDFRIGIEQEYYSDYFFDYPKESFDYIIGSVHNIKMGDEYICIDYKEEMLTDGVNKYFNGDFYLLIEKYFELVGKVVDKTRADIIGHFDLIKKLNKNNKFFDEESKRYKEAALNAAKKLLDYNIPFEINFGGIYKGYRQEPYPAPFILDYIRQNGGSYIYSSDAHTKEAIGYFPWR